MAVYLKFTGIKQGLFAGEVKTAGFAGQIHITSLNFGLGHPFSLNTHQVTGGTIVRTVKIHKHSDKSSALFINAAATNETGSAKFTYTKEGSTTTNKAMSTVELTNALVVNYDHTADDAGNGVEVIELSFTKIDYTWLDGGIMASVDTARPA